MLFAMSAAGGKLLAVASAQTAVPPTRAPGTAPEKKAGNPATPLPEKDARTVAQAKLDSHIVLALKKSRREAPFDKPTSLDPDLAVRADGRVLVDLDAKVSKELLEHIARTGGQVINSFEQFRAIRAIVPLTQMEALGGRADVKFISPAAEATTNPVGDPAEPKGATGSAIKSNP